MSFFRWNSFFPSYNITLSKNWQRENQDRYRRSAFSSLILIFRNSFALFLSIVAVAWYTCLLLFSMSCAGRREFISWVKRMLSEISLPGTKALLWGRKVPWRTTIKAWEGKSMSRAALLSLFGAITSQLQCSLPPTIKPFHCRCSTKEGKLWSERIA